MVHLPSLHNQIKRAIAYHKKGNVKMAIQENNSAIKKVEYILEVLKENHICFELNTFLKGDSSITRKPKCKNSLK